ncbi:MAG: PAS domain S-box protein [Actinomycetota bacterium]|nr:PAS domain S-box protein [Actinomycetota bacterium]
MELRARSADGLWLHLEIAGTNLMDDPEVSAVVACIRDITACREAEEALEKERRQFRNLIETCPVSLIIYQDGGI